MTELRIREAVRALVIDTDDRILLVRWLLRGLDVWGTPGGGMDEGDEMGMGGQGGSYSKDSGLYDY